MTKPISILVIDDDHEVRRVISDNLDLQGFNVREAENGQKGLDILETDEDQPQCVITDLMMPEKEGFGVVREIKNRNPNIKLIVISGKSVVYSFDYLDMARKLGADAVFQKPVDINLLVKEIHSLCK